MLLFLQIFLHNLQVMLPMVSASVEIILAKGPVMNVKTATTAFQRALVRII